MDKKTYIIGIGMGNIHSLGEYEKNIISDSDMVIGAKRMLESCNILIKETAHIVETYDSNMIADKIKGCKEDKISVLMSGDTGFYSGAKKLYDLLDDDAEIIAGISSMSYLASKIGLTWEDAHVVSMHGRNGNLPFAVLTHKKTFVITGGKINDVMSLLKEYNLGHVKVYIGKNLGSTDEKIIIDIAENFIEENEGGLYSLFIINEKPENRMRFIKDSEFIRNETPMTKESVRNHIISSFDVDENSVIYDIGSGTGSVSLMLARLVPKGRVYAFDNSQKAMEVLEKNKRKLSIDHVEGILGTAPDVFNERDIITPNAVFVGGSKGRIKDILTFFFGSNIPVIISAVTIETFAEVIGLIDDKIIKNIEVSQVSISEGVALGSYNMLKSQNPIWIIKGIV